MPRHADSTHELVTRLLRGRRDVAIGARARRNRLLRAGLAAGGLVLIIGSLWLYHSLSALAGLAPGSATTITVRCVECGKDATLTLPAANASRVADCPHCHARAAYKLWQCRTCGERFLPPAPEHGAMIRCPKCSGTQVGTAAAP